jgi:NAD(P)H dehydrogenase (quinone)
MNVLIVYAHPEPTSFCAALRDRAVGTIRAAGHEVTVSDLYRDGFDPVAGRHDFTTVADPDRFHYQSEQLLAAREGGFSDEIRREQDRVRQADLFIIIYPIWWGGPPAIFKGWLDRVLAYGFAYEDGQRFETGFFRGRRGLIGMATGGTPQRFSRDGAYGDIDQVMWPTPPPGTGIYGPLRRAALRLLRGPPDHTGRARGLSRRLGRCCPGAAGQGPGCRDRAHRITSGGRCRPGAAGWHSGRLGARLTPHHRRGFQRSGSKTRQSPLGGASPLLPVVDPRIRHRDAYQSSGVLFGKP